MSSSQLPERASLEYLKKLAKDRLQDLRRTDPHAKLATALLAVAREYGFASWRALKTEVDRLQAGHAALFFDLCEKNDNEAMRALIANEPSLVRATKPDAPHGGWTALHAAAQREHLDVVRLLLAHGADPNAREAGDNTCPLHWAAANRHLDIVRALLDAGGDPHGLGDVHQLDAIGWASVYHPPDGAPGDRPEVVSLLIDRGARHHIFSAISMGDLNVIRHLVEDNPGALDRRMSRFEQGQTPLHFAMSRKRYDILDLLIELGADLEAEDRSGRTALAAAMLEGDREAMNRLHAAGAKQPQPMDTSNFTARMDGLADSTRKIVPMIFVPDVARALEWYVSIGFKELARYGEDGVVNFGMVAFGKAEIMLNMHGKKGEHDVTLWLYTDQVDNLYQLLKSRQIEAAQASLTGKPGHHAGIEFIEDINDTFYGAREFGIRDLDGYTLYFIQPS